MSATNTDESLRAWQRMLSGRRLDLLDPSPLDIEIEDIAHGLSRVARWNGQTHGANPFSVAEHSLLVERIMQIIRPTLAPRWRLAALLHDAPEYVIGDLISPFKAVIGGEYKPLERRLLAVVHRRFGIPAEMPPAASMAIRRADAAAAWFEATQLAGFSKQEAARFFRRPRFRGAKDIVLDPKSPNAAKAAFLTRFKALELDSGRSAV